MSISVITGYHKTTKLAFRFTHTKCAEWMPYWSGSQSCGHNPPLGVKTGSFSLKEWVPNSATAITMLQRLRDTSTYLGASCSLLWSPIGLQLPPQPSEKLQGAPFYSQNSQVVWNYLNMKSHGDISKPPEPPKRLQDTTGTWGCPRVPAVLQVYARYTPSPISFPQ